MPSRTLISRVMATLLFGWICVARLTADSSHFNIAAKLTAWEGKDQIYQQEWNERIRRRLA